MDTKEILSIRQAVAQLKEGSEGRVRYPESIKSSVLSLLRSGMKLSEICKATDLLPASVANWKKEQEEKFRQVRVTKTPANKSSPTSNPTLRVTLPNGISIEGAPMATLKEIFGWFE
jgi:hypothetical protein